MASSKATSYRLCCDPATTEWVVGGMKYSSYLHGWLFPYRGSHHASSTFTWQDCPFCGRLMLPFEPTRPWTPETDDD